MKIKVRRYGYGVDSTGGLLFVENVHVGYTCEDERRDVKVMHETCIPSGLYQIKLRDKGERNEKYKTRFPSHRGMLHLQNVDGFRWIYIHVGNTDDDTSGCILVGRTVTRSSNGEYTVGQSVNAYNELYDLCCSALDVGEELWIEVT